MAAVTRSAARRRRDLRLGRTGVGVLLCLAACGLLVQVARGVPSPTERPLFAGLPSTIPEPAGGPLPWPAQGEADMVVPGVVDFPPVGDLRPVPIASITKVMTTLVLLHDHPLAPGAQGPEITITPADVARYDADIANGDSVVPIEAGEELTEYQAIEAMLIPSADDVAQAAAVWDRGSMTAFTAEMNAMARQWGLDETQFAGPSGVDAHSVSTAANLLVLARKAMAQPVIRQVVRLPSASLPVAGTVDTFDYALGDDDIVGIKTGSETAAGGCFLFAAHVRVDGRTRLAYGVVLGQQSTTSILEKALDASVDLVAALHRVLQGVTLIPKGVVVGQARTVTGRLADLVTARAVHLVAAPGDRVRAALDPGSLPGDHSEPPGTPAGRLVLHVGGEAHGVELVTAGALREPSRWWTLLHG